MRRSFRRPRRGPRSKLSWGWAWAYTCPASTATWNSGTGCDDVHVVNVAWARVPAGVFDTTIGDYTETDLTLLRSLVSYTSSVRIAGASNDALVTHSVGLIAWDGRDDSLPSVLDVPFPSTEAGFDWIFRIAQPDSYTATAQTAVALAQSFPRVQRDAESKAKRKLSAGTGLLWVMDTWLQRYTSGGIQTATVQQSVNARLLYKLP